MKYIIETHNEMDFYGLWFKPVGLEPNSDLPPLKAGRIRILFFEDPDGFRFSNIRNLIISARFALNTNVIAEIYLALGFCLIFFCYAIIF